ncbi:MAG: ATP-binding protein, partial [Bacteroidales bacterium]|nr:ATP-binding protein [Bacteroidales bacterium]
MREQIIFNQLTTNLGNVPTEDQSGVLKKIAGWLASGQEEIFLLTGYAGTGKTSVISTL